MQRIPLRARDGSVRAYALVDDVDFEWLSQWRWSLDGGYVVRFVGTPPNQRKVYMHRQILGLEGGDKPFGEHENRDRSDNQRSNLRIAPRRSADNAQNQGMHRDNTSGYLGVTWERRKQRWKAQVGLDGRNHHLGYFVAPEEAAAAVRVFRAERMPFSQEAHHAAA